MTTSSDYPELERLRDAIDTAWDIAHEFGLDPFPTHFELVPASIMYEFASYGLPGRFSHWTHGKAYYRQKMQYDFGLSKIYEMVVNTNPSYAFLMEMNNLLQNTFVAAHVFGHTDFFKNNAYFNHTSRRMIDKASIHAERIAKYEFDHGKDEVERYLDAALSIQEHIDYNLFLRSDEPLREEKTANVRASEYDDLWGLDERAKRAEEERDLYSNKPHKFPEKPEKDILLFLIRHAPHLDAWQRDILEIVRSEMLYFVPQMQTKVMNEGWACLVGDSLILTELGFVRYDRLHTMLASGMPVRVGSGTGKLDKVTARHITRNAATVRISTRRGFVLEGAEGHKLNIGPDSWLELKDVNVGQRVPLCVGENIWPQQLASLATAGNVISSTAAVQAVSGSSYYRSTAGSIGLPRLRTAASEGRSTYNSYSHHYPLVAPTYMTEALAELFGYLVGNGSLDQVGQAICFSTAYRELAERYSRLVLDLFAIETTIRWDEQTGGWQVVFYSQNVLDLLYAQGIDLETARMQSLPDAILRSPRSVMSAFLGAYFDCSGYASASDGICLLAPEDLARTVQIVLLNYGILSRRSGTLLGITGSSARLFAQEIGFRLDDQRALLAEYLEQPLADEVPVDEVVSIEYARADVYDITVDDSHQYVANGMLHHNSIWHSRIMRELADRNVVSDSEVIEFAQLHSSVLSPSRTSLNPYYIGFKIFEDIERRWNNPSREEQERLGRKPNTGREKMFEVRELDNDVSFLRNYLTEDLIKDLDLYLYRKEGDEWVIVEKDWRKVRDGIVASMTNFGYPYLVVEDGDYRGNRELYIKHLFEGQELDLAYAEKTLQHVYTLWGRPVHLETQYDGKRILLTYDGERNSKSTLEK
jgi:stage V sporulation protein R